MIWLLVLIIIRSEILLQLPVTSIIKLFVIRSSFFLLKHTFILLSGMIWSWTLLISLNLYWWLMLILMIIVVGKIWIWWNNIALPMTIGWAETRLLLLRLLLLLLLLLWLLLSKSWSVWVRRTIIKTGLELVLR